MLNWRTLGAVAAGAAHTAAGRGCEDGFAVAVTANGQLIAALADGAGSYETTSAHGSSTATRAAVDYLIAALAAESSPSRFGDEGGADVRYAPQLSAGPVDSALSHQAQVVRTADDAADDADGDVTGEAAYDATGRLALENADEPRPGTHREQLLLEAMEAAVSAVDERAADLGLAPQMLSSTLALAVVEDQTAVVAQIGDGVTVLRTSETARWVVPEAKSGYANLTWFLRRENLPMVRVATVSGVDAVALSSDGLRYQICDLANDEPYAPFFDHLWSILNVQPQNDADLAEYLDSIDNSQANHDDKSLILAVAVTETAVPVVKRSLAPPTTPSPDSTAQPSPAHTGDRQHGSGGAALSDVRSAAGAGNELEGAAQTELDGASDKAQTKDDREHSPTPPSGTTEEGPDSGGTETDRLTVGSDVVQPPRVALGPRPSDRPSSGEVTAKTSLPSRVDFEDTLASPDKESWPESSDSSSRTTPAPTSPLAAPADGLEPGGLRGILRRWHESRPR